MKNIESKYLDLKEQLLFEHYSFLNKEQRMAVLTTNGALLILAGAGSGKTTVLTQRIAHLAKYGTSYEDKAIPYQLREADIETLQRALEEKKRFKHYSYPSDVVQLISCNTEINPYHIMAITFTNKAAKEMKERIEKIIGPSASTMWVSTFHSACARILRSDIDKLGYGKNFTIYDTADQVSVIKMILKEQNLDVKLFSPKSIIGQISTLKNNTVSPAMFLRQTKDDYRLNIIAKIYESYAETLKKNNALDFDDLIIKTIELLKTDEETLNKYADKFKYVLVDEYQDTNQAQYELVRLLASNNKSICVVGDDDQSIYAWRGADIRNILEFEKDYQNAKMIRLERNYRSTQTILEAANHVIANNQGRKGKNLWTDKKSSSKIIVNRLRSDRDESDYVAQNIYNLYTRNQVELKDIAILYRTNSQSRSIEEGLMKYSLKYKIYGGIRFYDRKEVKDIIAYLCLINNPADNVSLLRIINTPKRGIGNATVEKLVALSSIHGISVFELLLEKNELIPPKIFKKLQPFLDLIMQLIANNYVLSVPEFIESVLTESGYLAMLEQDNTIENQTRIENINQLINAAQEFQDSNPDLGLTEFLENVALVSGDDNDEDGNQQTVSLMTIHSAKGLEFSYVFLMGFEEKLFPHMMSMESDSGIEEERRLCYVAITRAKKQLVITHAGYRFINGTSMDCIPSRFLREIPDDLIEYVTSMRKNTGFQTSQSYVKKPSISKSYSHPIPRPTPKKQQKFSVGDHVLHKVFGKGQIIDIQDDQVVIAFEKGGNRKFSLAFAPLKIINK